VTSEAASLTLPPESEVVTPKLCSKDSTGAGTSIVLPFDGSSKLASMTSASFSAELVVAGLTSLYGMLWLLVSLRGLYMMARASISWKKSDKAPHGPTVEDCASYTEQMLSLLLSEKHYMFLVVTRLHAGASSLGELHSTPG
jgi:hypothetical protein